MVKVLVPGRNRIYTTVCKWCRSVLEYQQDDIVEENVEEARKREQTFPTFISQDSIKCPNCNGHIIVATRTWIRCAEPSLIDVEYHDKVRTMDWR